MKFTCINIQGNLISEEVLTKVGEATASDQLPKDFGLEPDANLRDEIEYAWSRIKLDYKHFADRASNLPSSDPYGTTMARKWMEQFFSSLGFDLEKHRTNLLGENKQEYNISHSVRNNDGLPVSIVGFFDPNHVEKNTLDIKSSGGTSRLSPHGTVQEYLNVTGHVYGFASNGFTLRLIRDSGRLVKLSYIEFDLRRLLDEDKYSEFTVLYRLIHSSRFPIKKEETSNAPIEKYFLESIETGNRIRDGLSLAVKESMVALGNGFLQHPQNESLREALLNKKITPKQYYDQLRRLVYRLLFLLVTEERDLIYEPEDKSEETAKKKSIYLKYYSIARLRKLSQNRYLYEVQFTDLWQGLINTFNLFEEGGNGLKIGIKPLAGDLFSDKAIENISQCTISNNLLLECLRNLNEFREKETKNLVHINYRSLDVEELGSVYEGLLELFPVIEHLESTNPANIRFTFHEGTERKTTGSYYTRPDLVNELIKSALIPVIEERLKEAGSDKEKKLKSLIKLKVCDAAAGSGHMMLAAARTIAWYMAVTDTGEENPPPSKYRYWLREAIQHCVYAVDMNPDAVELCKLALWLEGHNSGKPLSFLDHKIRNGNSLVGVTDLGVLKKGIPDDAFNPVTGDDKKICQELKKENTRYNKTKQGTFDFDQVTNPDTKQFSDSYNELESIRQDDIEAVKKTKKKFEELRSNHQWWTDWTACNLWTSAFFFEYTEEHKQSAPNSERLEKYLSNPSAAYGPMVGKANALAIENKFFHWSLEFPDVFEQGGFDVMLGNPPWEKTTILEREYFIGFDNIVNEQRSNIRKKTIEQLKLTNNEIYEGWQKALIQVDKQKLFLTKSTRFPLSAVGELNLYPMFVELFATLINPKGKSSLIIKSGMLQSPTWSDFTAYLIDSNKLLSAYDFRNWKGFFPSIGYHERFSLITLSNDSPKIKFGFYLDDVAEIENSDKVFDATKQECEKINPLTKNVASFSNKKDKELLISVYNRTNIIGLSKDWNIRYSTGLHMSSDANELVTFEELINRGFNLEGNIFKSSSEIYYPLLEGKLIHIYDNRFATFEGIDKSKRFGIKAATNLPTENQKSNFDFEIIPRYWVSENYRTKDIESRGLRTDWNITFRDTTNVISNFRTFVACIASNSVFNYKAPNLLINEDDENIRALKSALLLSIINSIPFDFITRLKFYGANLIKSIIDQLPIIPYDLLLRYKDEIVPRVMKLTYTSNSLRSFSDSIKGNYRPYEWNNEERFKLRSELDCIIGHLYSLTKDDMEYILDSFPILKSKDEAIFDSYRTKEYILSIYDDYKEFKV